jgi:integrase
VKPGTVNRELDTLKSILSEAVEWTYLVDSPARGVKRFRLQNRRTRILSADEQRRLHDACERMPKKLQALLKLALITGARIGELLALRWEDCQDGSMTFWQTKNGKVRRGSPSRTRSPHSWPIDADPPVGVHEREDRETVYDDS